MLIEHHQEAVSSVKRIVLEIKGLLRIIHNIFARYVLIFVHYTNLLPSKRMAKASSEVPLGIACVLAIIFVVSLIFGFAMTHLVNDAAGTAYPWCYGDWMCKAPSTEGGISVFNSLHPNACSTGTPCTIGEDYNVYNLNADDQGLSKCADPAESDTIIVNLETGCYCLSVATNNPCTLAEFEANAADSGCDQTLCGRMNKHCGEFDINIPGDVASTYSTDIDPNEWVCPGTTLTTNSDNSKTGKVCSYTCPNNTPTHQLHTADDFLNSVVFRYVRQAS
jgi:hypothetical protein